MPVKSDRNDARGIAQLMRLGWFRPVHCKSIGAQETRVVLTARKLVQSKLRDVENSLRGILRGFGLKVGKTTELRFAGRIRELVAGHPSLEAIAESLLSVHAVLLREFKATPHAVLLATSSFWQGVDVVGDALSCVIIDKLPFASPGDPITAARVEAITARGGSAFGEYQIPLAILALKQGLGRLLRHRQDRGVLAVLDPRLKTMAYGKRFLASLPPAPVTQDMLDIERFFARDEGTAFFADENDAES